MSAAADGWHARNNTGTHASCNAKYPTSCRTGMKGIILGDSKALSASRHLQKQVPKRLTKCDPDMLGNPKSELRRLQDGYTEIKGSRAIAQR
jgi:hypothetical protein